MFGYNFIVIYKLFILYILRMLRDYLNNYFFFYKKKIIL